MSIHNTIYDQLPKWKQQLYNQTMEKFQEWMETQEIMDELQFIPDTPDSIDLNCYERDVIPRTSSDRVTDNGTCGSTSPMKSTLKPLLPKLDKTLNEEESNISSLEELKLERNLRIQTINNNTSTSQLSLSIKLPDKHYLEIGTLETESVIISVRGTDLCLTPDGNHHIKEYTKVDKEKCIIFEDGKLPNDVAKAVDGQYTKRSDEEKKRKLDEILIDMRDMLEKDQDEEAFKKYPRNYLLYGERLKAAFYQKRDKLQSTGDPHIWLHGPAGCGKSAVLNFIYPNYYKKNLYNRFFDLYDPKQHSTCYDFYGCKCD